MNRTAKTLAATATGAVALGLGIGVAGLAAADPTASPSPSASSPATPPAGAPGGPGDHRGGPGRGDHDPLAAQLATKLGLDQTKVETALREYRDANRPTAKPDPSTTKPDPAAAKPDPTAEDAALAKALADKLDVTEAKVTTALKEIRATRAADRSAAVKQRLADAVKAGTLTQTEADAVQKAADAGIVNVGPR